MLKAMVLALAIAGAVIVAATLVWRDQRTRHLEVVVDADTDKALRALGSELDLRQAFVDALNERVRAVKEVLTLDDSNLLDTRATSTVSFKPFGLDVQGNQLTELVRVLLNSEPPALVRVELLCAPACAPSGAGSGSLLVTLSGAAGSQRVSFPVRLANPLMRRQLRMAMQRAAELLLERTEPLVAAIYYLNIAPQHVLFDEVRRDYERAAVSALKLRDAKGATSCVADLVLGVSLIQRGSLKDGLDVEKRAGKSGDPVCQVHSATNIVYALFANACNADPKVRKFAANEAAKSFEDVSGRRRVALGDKVYDRIPSSQLLVELTGLLNEPGNENARMAFCGNTRVGSPIGDNTIASGIRIMLGHVKDWMPPKASMTAEHNLLELLLRVLEAGVPREDVVARYTTAQAMSRVIDDYLPTDGHQRKLFMLHGRLAMIMASAVQDTFSMPATEKAAVLKPAGADPASVAVASDADLRTELFKRMEQAHEDFENAVESDTVAVLIEPVPDIEPLTLLGDIQFAMGEPAARATYERAVDAFIEADAPVDQLIALASAVTRLTVLQIAGGACRTGAPTAATDPRWQTRAFAPKDLCALAAANEPVAVPGLLQLVRPLVAPAIATCVARLSPSPTAAFSVRERFALLDCLAVSGTNDPRVSVPFLADHFGSDANAAIDRALGSAR